MEMASLLSLNIYPTTSIRSLSGLVKFLLPPKTKLLINTKAIAFAFRNSFTYIPLFSVIKLTWNSTKISEFVALFVPWCHYAH